jgi:hypothetical protein
MPLYLQVARGATPSAAGLLLTPMMGGVFVTSIVSGQIISRIGRYRLFPIAGTAIMTLGLGLGLGMVMQVLVLAVQNAIDYRELGVATSGTTLFRSTGGSVGVSLFGAIFAASLASGLADRLPGGWRRPMRPIQARSGPSRWSYAGSISMSSPRRFIRSSCWPQRLARWRSR